MIHHFSTCNRQSIFALHIIPRPGFPSFQPTAHFSVTISYAPPHKSGEGYVKTTPQINQAEHSGCKLILPLNPSYPCACAVTLISLGNTEGGRNNQGAKIGKKNDGPWFLYRCIGTSKRQPNKYRRIWAASVVAFAKFMARGFAMVCVAQKREGAISCSAFCTSLVGRTDGRTVGNLLLRPS